MRLLAVPIIVLAAIIGCEKTKTEATNDAGTTPSSSGGTSGDIVSPPTVDDDAGIREDGGSCPSIAHDDDFERDTVESPAWKLVTGTATLALNTGMITGKSLNVKLLDGPAPRISWLERGFPADACRITVSFKLRFTTVPPEGAFVDVARIVVAGGLLSVRINGPKINLIEHGIAPDETVTGSSIIEAGTVTADEVLGVAFVLDRRGTTVKIGISLTEAAPSASDAKYVVGRPRFLSMGSAGANTGPDVEYHLDNIRIR